SARSARRASRAPAAAARDPPLPDGTPGSGALAALAQAGAERRHDRRAAAPRQADENRSGVVAVPRLAEVEVLVRPVDEPVAAGGNLRDVELLPVEERRVAI